MAQGIEELVCRPDDLNLSLGLYRVTNSKEMNPDSCALGLHMCPGQAHTYTHKKLN